MACFGVRYVRRKPWRRIGAAADGAWAARVAPTRLIGLLYLQGVDEVGIDRALGLDRRIDLSQRLPEVTGRLVVVGDLPRVALGPHDGLTGLEVEQRERVEVGLHVLGLLLGRFAHDVQAVVRVLLEPAARVVVR